MDSFHQKIRFINLVAVFELWKISWEVELFDGRRLTKFVT